MGAPVTVDRLDPFVEPDLCLAHLTPARGIVSPASAFAVALTFVWLGMVLAISFLEAPLKFRAPGVTLQIGLGIGRMVFRALNTVESLLAVGILAALTLSRPSVSVVVAFAIAVVALVGQLLGVRPLARRSDAVLAGDEGPARAHYAYVLLEVVKVIGLALGGILIAVRLNGEISRDGINFTDRHGRRADRGRTAHSGRAAHHSRWSRSRIAADGHGVGGWAGAG